MSSKNISSIVRLFLYGFLFFFLYYPDRFYIKFDYPTAPLGDSIYVRLAKAFLLLLIIIEILRVFYYSVVKPKAKGLIANVLTLAAPLAIVILLLEITFMFVAQSQEGVLSKASQIWWEKYWQPVNSLGYRDREAVVDPNKKNVLVIGDSFAAGHGLAHVNERFSDQLQEKLGNGFRVFNLGVSGSDTRDEAERLRKYPVKPDMIVLQYFPNDIEKVGAEKGLTLNGSAPYADLKGPLATVVKRFYLPNYLYWQIPHAQFSTFEDFVRKSYGDTTILNAHLRDLSEILTYRDSCKAKMYTVFIPFLLQLNKSHIYTKPVEDFLRQHDVNVVTIDKEVAKIPEINRRAGKNDGHASAEVNAIISQKLYDSMKH